MFKEVGIIEKYGSGIKRVRQIMSRAGALEPEFEVIADTFKVTLFPLPISTHGGVKELLALINRNPGMNVSQLCEIIQVPKRSLERYLQKLRNEGKIEFKGAFKTGGYFIKRN